jgi:hypothetical protein
VLLNALFPLLLIVFFLHGIFASGFIPILNHVLGTDASWAFAVYFGGLLVGQVAIYFFGWLSNKRWHLTFYEVIFGFSLILMGYLPPDWLVLGRGIEGLAGGLATVTGETRPRFSAMNSLGGGSASAASPTGAVQRCRRSVGTAATL